MGLRPGQTNNLKGRPKKSLTKLSSELRESITCFLSDNFKVVRSEFEKIDNPTQKIKLYIELLNFSLPRLKASESISELGNLTTEELDYIIEQLKADHEKAHLEASKN